MIEVKDFDKKAFVQSGSPTALKKMAVGEPDRVVWSFGNHVTAFVSAIGHLSCKESFFSTSFIFQVVKNGVAQAQEELRKEADNQIWQEGILR